MLKKIKNRFFSKNPLGHLLADKDYKDVLTHQRFKTGQTKLWNKPFRYSDNHGFLHSLEEVFEQQVYRFHSEKADPYIIDAGANIGLSVAYFKQLFPQASLVAFEPDPHIFQLLQQNTASLGLSQVELRNAAAWTEDTELTFFAEGSLAGSTEVSLVDRGKTYSVQAERLKKWLSGKEVDFLKIDIEGAENSVLFDLEPELSQVAHLFLEYHSIVGKEQKLGDLLEVIKRAGFRYHIKSASNPVRFPFTERVKKGFDMQLNIFCFRQ
ncbi:MAG: FkbM family methyltransferase [Adhaeribacter sp.]